MICKKCGKEVDDKSVICVHCGSKVKKKRNKLIIIVLSIICIVCAISVFIGITSFNNDMKNATNYIASRQFDSAREILDKHLKTNSEQTQVYLVFADYYLAQNEYLNAVDILDQGLSKCSSAEDIQKKSDDIKNKYASEIATEVEQREQEEQQKKQEEEQKQNDEQLKIQEEKQRQQAQYISECNEIEYSALARNPDKFKGQSFKFTGEVIQVVEPIWGNTVSLRINVTKGEYGLYSDTIFATVELAEGSDRLLEDDIITIYGDCDGLYTYKSVFGSSVSIPKIDIKYFSIDN